MDEKELFNKDSMYWRELNISVADAVAEIVLTAPIKIEGEETSLLRCILLPFESADVEYEMENGGAYRKNEVIQWPYILPKDYVFYADQSQSEEDRKKKIQYLEHSNMHSITLKDNAGNSILTKSKI